MALIQSRARLDQEDSLEVMPVVLHGTRIPSSHCTAAGLGQIQPLRLRELHGRCTPES
jgi:hypothetical protein